MKGRLGPTFLETGAYLTDAVLVRPCGSVGS